MGKNLKRIGAAAGCALAGILLAMSGGAAQQRTMVLSGGTLIDGTGRAPITDAVVVVRGNRITAVGKRGQVQIPAGATIIKTDGRTILPGLIDTHSHTQEWHMPLYLHFGVTTIQDKNNDPAWIYAEREGLRNGTIKGPRMFVGGATLHATGYDFNTASTKTADEIRAVARRTLADGADALNVNQSISEDQLKAVIAVGKEAGVPVLGHVPNIRRAAELGYRYQEHMFMMGAAILDPEAKTNIGLVNNVAPEALVDPAKYPPLIEYMVKQGIYVNPTLVNNWSVSAPRGPQYVRDSLQMAKDPAYGFVPAPVRALWDRVPAGPRRGYANVAEFVRQYSAAGGKVIVGTDSSYSTIPGLSEHYEMQMLVDVGVTPMKAIQGATLWNAELILKDKDLGSVEPGKLADFVIIEGDPLQDIRNTMNIRTVIKDGAVIDTKLDPKWVNPIPAPFTTYTDPPAITKVSPAIVRQGSGTVTLEIEGTDFSDDTAGFSPNAVVRFDTNDLPTKFVSPTKLTATLDAKLLQRSPGLYPLYVVMPGLHGTVSPGTYEVIDAADAPVHTFPVTYPKYAIDKPWLADRSGGNNAPILIGPNPRSARQGSGTVTLEIEGTKFEPNAIVRFDNEDLPTKFVSSTKLTATLDAKFLQRPVGSYVVYVLNPGVYGTVSIPGYFQVNRKN